MRQVAVLPTVKMASSCVLRTRRSGDWPISAKLLARLSPPGGSTMALIAEGVLVLAVAVPPSEPTRVWPFSVPTGWVGSVTV